jgi:predicted esterase
MPSRGARSHGLVALPVLLAAIACGAGDPAAVGHTTSSGDDTLSHSTSPEPDTAPATVPSSDVITGAIAGGGDVPTPSAAPSQPAPAPAPAPRETGEPIIPVPSGPCPEFRTGSQTILGLDTEIVAGTPGAVPGPLLFTWHGTGGSGRQALAQLPRSVQSEVIAQGGLIVAPSDNGQVRAGQDVTFVLGVWYDGADLSYADQIVACAVQNHNIDPRQIYVTGCSAGGLMAGVMSLERSSYVAAAAPSSGGLATGAAFRLQDPEHVPAVMTMHGGTSDNVIVNFGETSRALADVLVPAGGFVIDCNHGSGHCGAPASLHELAWKFMQAHPFGTTPSPFESGLPAEFPALCTVR